ncbi:hypothetical protein KY332_04680 [Candidatus Woesearchaeota archaeon]|nr:hypothetical protein [Candidatus Woesearchaeota archaeon]
MDEENKDKKLVDEDDSWFEEDKTSKEEIKVKELDSDPEDEPIKVKKEEPIKVKEPDPEDEPIKVKKEEPEPFVIEEDNSNAKKWKIVSAVLAILLIAAVWTGGFGFERGKSPTGAAVGEASGILILNDERCESCDTTNLIAQLTESFPDVEMTELDYSSDQGAELYKDAELTVLPAVLFKDEIKDHEGYAQVEQFLDQAGDYLSLRIGATFDPNAEICDNDVDDNDDGKTDCEDESCSGSWMCMEKKDVPEVELFVMSHCPYGTQIEKGMIPVVELLGDKIDFEVKFCDYAMHGQTELDEQTTQFCIQEEQKSKYLDYLKCFLKEGKSAECITEAGVDATAAALCEQLTDVEYKITENFGDKSTWKGNFPTFNIHAEEVAEYGVRGSPTLVINGATATAGRDSKSLLRAVCTGFTDKPSECEEELSAAPPAPGFGFEPASNGATAATCG